MVPDQTIHLVHMFFGDFLLDCIPSHMCNGWYFLDHGTSLQELSEHVGLVTAPDIALKMMGGLKKGGLQLKHFILINTL